MAEKVSTGFLCPEETYAEIKELAEQEGRSIAQTMLRLIQGQLNIIRRNGVVTFPDRTGTNRVES